MNLTTKTLILPTNTNTIYSSVGLLGEPFKVVVALSSTDGLFTAFELLSLTSSTGTYHSVYGRVGDNSLPIRVSVVDTPTSVDITFRNTHTAAIDVVVTPLIGGGSITAFI